MNVFFKNMTRLLPNLAVAGALALSSPALAESVSHDTVACGSCHSSGTFVASSNAASRAEECRGCHQPADLAQGRFHQSEMGDCLDCHSFHSPEVVTTSVGDISLIASGMKENGHCQSCHDSRGRLGTLSPAHKVAAQLYHAEASTLTRESPSQACLRCHGNTSDSTWQSATEGHLSFNTHASHPFSVPVIPGKGNSSNWIAHQIDPRLPIFDGKMECQTCHLLTADNEDLMVPFETKYDLCLGCHKHHGDEIDQPESLMASFVRK